MSTLDKAKTTSAVVFTSRWAMVMVILGAAVGPANVWRFPRMAATYGGGAFILVYIISAFLWAIPLLIMEGSLGKGSRFGVMGAFRTFMGKKFTWIGGWITIVVLFMTAYFNVVGGWFLRYTWLSVSGKLNDATGVEMWTGFYENPIEVVFWHVLMALITGVILYQGLVKGIEWASKWMLPVLLIMMVGCAVWAISRPGGLEGLDYLFTIQPEYLLKSETWLQGFTQMAWSAGAGWGLFLTYSTYFRNKDSIGTNAATVVMGDSTVGILAAMIVLPGIFSTITDPEQLEAAFAMDNQGITFVVLPDMFNSMPGGMIFASIFFFAVVLAFLTCQFACFENPIKGLQDMGIGRHKAVVVITIAVCIIGLPSALKLDFLNNQDWVWGIGLMLVGLLISISVLKRGPEFIRNNVVNTTRKDNLWIGKWWNVTCYLFPVLFVVLFGWWAYQGVLWYPGDWWNPTEVYSLGTMIAQWSITLIIAMFLNNFFNKHTNPISDVMSKNSSLLAFVKPWDEMTIEERKRKEK